MKTSQIVVLGLIIVGVFSTLEVRSSHAEGDLEAPKPCEGDDHGAVNPLGQPFCSGDLEENLHKVSYETAIEDVASQSPILSFVDLAKHVIKHAKQAMGFEAILSDEDLASIAWYFRLRHMPAPVYVAEKSTVGDSARLVRHVLTNQIVKNAHHFSEAKINALIDAVKKSVESPYDFVFRVFEGYDYEYQHIHLHQLAARQHYFAAVHTSTELYVVFVGSEILGEFIKGHGGSEVIQERAYAAQFLRQWLLNQWVNYWICTNAECHK